MMTDRRSFDGWRRLRAKVMEQAASDDPAGLAQIIEELATAQAELVEVMAALTGQPNKWDVHHEHPYSQGELARELGVTRPAITKRLRNRGA
jgi:hypothetical protein